MGCNSHPYIEVKKDDKWEYFKECEESRNYLLYSFLAGVRNGNGVTPVVAPRGLPENASKEVKEALYDYDPLAFHSFTWLTPEEFYEAIEKTKSFKYEEFGISTEWKNIKNTLISLQEEFGKENVRLVLGFDS